MADWQLTGVKPDKRTLLFWSLGALKSESAVRTVMPDRDTGPNRPDPKVRKRLASFGRSSQAEDLRSLCFT